MSISIAGIYDRGDLSKERIHFRANQNIDLSFIVLFDTRYLDGVQISAGHHTAYWFIPQVVSRGEHVVVYTRTGSPSTEKRANGDKYHFLFRGLGTPLYAEPYKCVTVMQLQTWATSLLTTASLPPLPALPGGLGAAFGAVSPPFTYQSDTGFGAQLADLLRRK